MSLVVVGSAEDIREFLCGPLQHNEHVKGYRWHQYIARFSSSAAMEEAKRIIAERRAMEEITLQAVE